MPRAPGLTETHGRARGGRGGDGAEVPEDVRGVVAPGAFGGDDGRVADHVASVAAPPAGASRVSRVSSLGIRELVEARQGESLELWARTINPQFARVLKTIGFDRTWVRAEGAHLWDADGNRFLDLLGGFGMFNVGRNNPRVRAALIEALELDLPGSVQLGASPLPPLLAEELLRRTPPRLERVLFTSTGTEAVEAALKLGRAATGRTRVVSTEHGFHGLTLGSLSANGNPEFTARFEPLLPGFARVPFGDLERARGRAAPRGRRRLPRRAGAGEGREPAAARLPRGRAGAVPPLRHALLRRRGADRLRPHRPHVRIRALGPRARPRHGREVAVGRLRAGRRAADVARRARGGVRRHGERVQPRLHVRAERAGDGRRPGDAARAGRAGPRRALGAPRRAAARADARRSSSATTWSPTCAGSA